MRITSKPYYHPEGPETPPADIPQQENPERNASAESWKQRDIPDDIARTLSHAPSNVQQKLTTYLATSNNPDWARMAIKEMFQMEEFLYLRDHTRLLEPFQHGQEIAQNAMNASDRAFEEATKHDAPHTDPNMAADSHTLPKEPMPTATVDQYGRVGLGNITPEAKQFLPDRDVGSFYAYLTKLQSNPDQTKGLNAAKIQCDLMQKRVSHQNTQTSVMESGYQSLLQNPALKEWSDYLKEHAGTIFENQQTRDMQEQGDKEQATNAANALLESSYNQATAGTTLPSTPEHSPSTSAPKQANWIQRLVQSFIPKSKS